MEQLDSAQKFKLKKFLKELSGYKGRHTELVSVYIPAGYDMNKIMTHLSEEQGTATNIKSTATRKNVINALERMIQHLKVIGRTPKNGLAVFSGNVSEREGKEDLQIWSVEPPAPLNVRIYRCDKEFVLEPLEKYLETKDVYGIMVMDRREATIGLLRGKAIEVLQKTSSNVPGKMRAGGQCLNTSTLIQSYSGDILEINKSHNPHIIVGADIENLSIKNTPIIDKWNIKKTEIYKITTKNPRLEIECSKDHVFFVREDDIVEKYAEDLNEGDYLLMPEKITIEPKKQFFNPIKYYNSFVINDEGRILLKNKRTSKNLHQKELAKETGTTQTAISAIETGKINVRALLLKRICEKLQLNFEEFIKKYTNPNQFVKLPFYLDSMLAQIIGYFVGDGNFENERIAFSEQTKEVAEYYDNLMKNYFNANTNIKYRENKNYWQIRVYGKPLVNFIKREFPEIQYARTSSIPKRILESENNIVASFLRGLFDAEGYVNPTRGIGLGMNNKKLIYQIQMLFLRFGIISSIHEYDNKANPYSNNFRYTIDITEKKSLRLFKNNIDFTAKYKYEKLDKLLTKKSNTSYVRQILSSGRKIRKIIEDAGYNIQLFPKVTNFFRDERMMSKKIFYNSILKIVKNKDVELYKTLKKIYELPILPVKVLRIEKKQETSDMVDISTQRGNFIANGLIVHNSAARFARLREGAAKDFYKKIADIMKHEYLPLVMEGRLKGIIIGGPGHTKNEFVDLGYITEDVNKKIIALKDLTYTDESGLHELVNMSEDILSKEEVAAEKRIVKEFLTKLATTPNLVSYGLNEVKSALEMGAVETLLISEELEENISEELENTAEQFNTKVDIISVDTREGVQLRDLGKIAAILRYPI